MSQDFRVVGHDLDDYDAAEVYEFARHSCRELPLDVLAALYRTKPEPLAIQEALPEDFPPETKRSALDGCIVGFSERRMSP